jgi:3-methyladenine DNA glycosylase AlkC
MEKEKFSLKDHLFNETKVTQVAKEIHAVHGSFNTKKFIKDVVVPFPSLELKQRITHIAACLQKHLPPNFNEATAIIIKALPLPLDPNLTDDDFGDFIYAPYTEFIATYGAEKKHLKTAMNALYECTKRFSAEYAIRTFINKFPEEVHTILLKWSTDKNYHVRRLCSEGTRPSLPWASKIIYTSENTLPILQNLYADNTRFVTRSVANHLNDISKKEPQLVIDLLQKWTKEKKQKTDELNFIIKHSLRTLIKDGHAKALEMVGIGDAKGVAVDINKFDTHVKIGTAQQFEFSLICTQAKSLLIDYIVYFCTKNGKHTTKVFKIKSVEASAKEKYTIAKQHKFLAGMTTRSLTAGVHKIAIQVNGTVLAEFEFNLTK